MLKNYKLWAFLSALLTGGLFAWGCGWGNPYNWLGGIPIAILHESLFS